ncbi:unnamed protein product [Ectocarpus sp. 4 AP-2014]
MCLLRKTSYSNGVTGSGSGGLVLASHNTNEPHTKKKSPDTFQRGRERDTRSPAVRSARLGRTSKSVPAKPPPPDSSKNAPYTAGCGRQGRARLIPPQHHDHGRPPHERGHCRRDIKRYRHGMPKWWSWESRDQSSSRMRRCPMVFPARARACVWYAGCLSGVMVRLSWPAPTERVRKSAKRERGRYR